MRNLLTFLAISLALASCKKECESDHTATLVIRNKGALVAFVEISKEYHSIDPGKTRSFEYDLLPPGSFDVIYQAEIDFRWGNEQGERGSVVAVFNQCETTSIEISN